MVGGPQRDEERERQEWAARVRFAVLRSWLLRLVSASVLLTFLFAGSYAGWLYERARSSDCESWALVDKDISEVVALRQREQAYQDDPDPAATFVVTGDEVTFLMRDVLEDAIQIRLQVDGHVVDTTLVVPAREGCYNVHYRGTFEVHDGVATAVPQTLVVGRADLTPWLWAIDGWLREVRPEDLPAWLDPAIGRSLKNTELLDVEDGHVRLRLKDRYQMW